MKINSIDIVNFRGFQHETREFKTNLTVVVLQDLAKAFPMIQFIVSTHNPFIVQSLQKDQLISFDDDVPPEGEPYRESLEDITSHRMGLKQDICSQR